MPEPVQNRDRWRLDLQRPVSAKAQMMKDRVAPVARAIRDRLVALPFGKLMRQRVPRQRLRRRRRRAQRRAGLGEHLRALALVRRPRPFAQIEALVNYLERRRPHPFVQPADFPLRQRERQPKGRVVTRILELRAIIARDCVGRSFR